MSVEVRYDSAHAMFPRRVPLSVFEYAAGLVPEHPPQRGDWCWSHVTGQGTICVGGGVYESFFAPGELSMDRVAEMVQKHYGGRP